MSPATHKLLSQVVRLLKGMVSALDEWLVEVPKSTKN